MTELHAPVPARCGWRDGWYVVPHIVSWRDLDAIGHVNNAVFISYFEFARTRYWLDLQQKNTPHDIEFIVARVECDYRAQLSFDEQIEIRVRIGEIRGSSFDFLTEVWREDGGELAASGRVVVVLFDWDAQQKRTVTPELREKIERFQERR